MNPEIRDHYPALAGILSALAEDFQSRLERCPHHDPWLVRRGRAELDALHRAVTANPDFTQDDLYQAVEAARKETPP
jgi:hypothetical protein